MIHLRPSTTADPLDPPSDRGADAAWAEVEALDRRAAERAAMLRTLADKGLELALALQEETMAAIAAGAPNDHGAGFVRAARMVRQTLALEARLDREVRPMADQAVAEAKAQAAAEAKRRDWARKDGFSTKETVCEAVAVMIEAAHGGDAARSEPLLDALYERLNDPADEADFEALSVGALVERVCQDLGFTPDWELMADEDWALDEAESADPASPFGRVGRRRLIPPWERLRAARPP